MHVHMLKKSKAATLSHQCGKPQMSFLVSKPERLCNKEYLPAKIKVSVLEGFLT